MVMHVALSSVRTEYGRVIRKLVANGDEPLVVADVQTALGVKHPQTARKVMQDLHRRGVMEFVEAGEGRAAELRLRQNWEWLGSPEFRGYVVRQPVTETGLCGSLITNHLAESQSERRRGKKRKRKETHSPVE
jgi:hypothetical protein